MTELPASHAAAASDCLARAQADMELASADEIDQAIALLAGQQIRRDSGIATGALVVAYHKFLKLPRDLLALAVERCCQNSPFRPMVSDLRAAVADELEARRVRLARLTPRQRP
jgi:hypothetical protein